MPAPIAALWIVWLIYWLLRARDVKPSRWRESWGSRALHVVPLLLVGVLIAQRHLPAAMTSRYLPRQAVLDATGTIMVAAGLGFAIWARQHLGRNWSGTVTVKQDHSLVRRGPYAYVRHPIYSGLLLALLGTAVAIGEWRGVVAFVLALLAFLRKIWLEENRMREVFPEYEQYRQHTAALIPFVF